MSRAKYIAITFLGIIPLGVIAQVQSPPAVKDTSKPAPVAFIAPAIVPYFSDTNIRVYAPAPVKNIEQKVYDFQRYSHGTSPGFRVQIDFGQERNALNKTRSDFSGKYPNVPTYVTYKQPYFRVSAGDFRTRLDAVRFLKTVKKDYPASFVVADRITPPPL
jgi:hypothetical protein